MSSSFISIRSVTGMKWSRCPEPSIPPMEGVTPSVSILMSHVLTGIMVSSGAYGISVE